jgi:drug/metabolite transporter (DMT)-like permease
MPFRQELVQLDCLFWLCAGLVFLGTTWIASKEGVTCLLYNWQLLDNSSVVLFILPFLIQNTLAQRKQWKTIFILSIVNFVLSNRLSTWGVKYISSGLGAIIGAIPLWIVIITFRGERLARLTVMGLIVSLEVYVCFTII